MVTLRSDYAPNEFRRMLRYATSSDVSARFAHGMHLERAYFLREIPSKHYRQSRQTVSALRTQPLHGVATSSRSRGILRFSCQLLTYSHLVFLESPEFTTSIRSIACAGTHESATPRQMGLFITEDGQHYKGWLAALLCCCAAVNSDEHPAEWSRSQLTARGGNHVYHEQPQLEQPPAYSYRPSRYSRAGSTDSERVLLKSASTPSIFNQGDPTPNDATKGTISKRESSSISTSPRVRRFDTSDRQRNGLVPLKLAPVTLRSPISDDDIPASEEGQRYSRYRLSHGPSDSEQDLLQHTQADPTLTPTPPESYRHSRESPFQRSQRLSADVHIFRSPASIVQPSNEDFKSLSAEQSEAPLPACSLANSLSKPTIEDGSSAMTSHPITDLPLRLRMKHSGIPSARDGAEPGTDREAIELNTIHEDDKLESPRPQTAKSEGHIPAVAPTMQVHARSETLTDIGSIFSRPLELRGPRAFDELLAKSTDQHAHSSGEDAKTRSRSGSRVSGWLSSVRTPNAASLVQTSSIEQGSIKNVRQPRARTLSRVSRSSSSVTATDSPALTTASTPTSQTHSRSTTAESRMTNSSFTTQVFASDEEKDHARCQASTRAETERQCQLEGWPALAHAPEDVGLAF
ncbi:hypothetical protein AMS68_006371 [Peltaster fructicola]|uniref:Uncharacterized protein n=1 Tax=Peltaster fructicola TaxID=286661 RepID=A0A6H0Y1G8_9PEZI|nr:hypothetical protein AMS68_006371 [Peltaster fructicola]